MDMNDDARLKKNSGASTRSDRSDADANRTGMDGTALTAEERRMALRKNWVQEVLPTPPPMKGYHVCWLSTTNTTDPIYRRVERGYQPVKASEIPGFGGQYSSKDSQYEGCISCNEMLLFKIPLETYNDLMTIYHHDIPIEQEGAIYDRLQTSETDSNGRKLGFIEGDYDVFGKRKAPQTPTFI
jgi:hypothetical protein